MVSPKRVQARRLKGFPDHHSRLQVLREQIMRVVSEQAQQMGFAALATPALEYSEILLGHGAESEKQLFRFQDQGQRDVAMRFDLTVPFARYVAEHHAQLSFPYKRVQMGPVWRAEKPQKGRFREFYQCDLDIVGVGPGAADFEILLCFQNIFKALDLNIKMHVGHRGLLDSLLAATVKPRDSEQLTGVLIALDKLEKIGVAGVRENMLQFPGVEAAAVDKLLEVLQLASQGDFAELESLLPEQEREVLRGLRQSMSWLEDVAASPLHLDLRIARGLAYYTGMVFETTLESAPQLGSVCSGGRYDNLLERFLEKQVPGVGGSLGLDRLVSALVDAGELEPELKIFIAYTGETMPQAFKLRHFLHGALKVNVSLALREQKLAKQFRYADKNNFTYVLVQGPDELAANSVSCKEMKTGQERKGLSFEGLVDYLSECGLQRRS